MAKKAKKTAAKLNAKQKRFAEEYLVDLNATQAAIRAGYSEKTAYSQGERLLKHVEVAKLIENGMQKRSERTGITQDRVLEELAKIGFSDIRKMVRWGISPGDTTSENAVPNGLNVYPISLIPSEKIDEDTAAAIQEVSLTQTGVRVKAYDKLAALDKIARHLGMYNDSLKLGNDPENPIPEGVNAFYGLLQPQPSAS